MQSLNFDEFKFCKLDRETSMSANYRITIDDEVTVISPSGTLQKASIHICCSSIFFFRSVDVFFSFCMHGISF